MLCVEVEFHVHSIHYSCNLNKMCMRDFGASYSVAQTITCDDGPKTQGLWIIEHKCKIMIL